MNRRGFLTGLVSLVVPVPAVVTSPIACGVDLGFDMGTVVCIARRSLRAGQLVDWSSVVITGTVTV